LLEPFYFAGMGRYEENNRNSGKRYKRFEGKSKLFQEFLNVEAPSRNKGKRSKMYRFKNQIMFVGTGMRYGKSYFSNLMNNYLKP
jgi:hypothetical protein